MFNHVMVALDGSSYSHRTLPTAIELAKKFGADLFVLHVSEHDRGRAAVYSLESPAEATRLVADAVETARGAGVKASGEVRDAAAQHTARTIVDLATTKGVDLIVMGSRGLSDVQGFFLGSVTHKVIQIADVPVLVDRAPVKDARAERSFKKALTV
ncbi:MAG TPA: universal stress protein [Candidatus Micrarchaeaceae archaeon]|nr:universal stress protein [Candidatus Micrarchaeaceae archaeon]